MTTKSLSSLPLNVSAADLLVPPGTKSSSPGIVQAIDLSISLPENLGVVPYFEQYLGVWAMREQELLTHAELFKNLDVALHLRSASPQESQERAAKYNYQLSDRVAVLNLSGSLMKHVGSMSNNTSTVKARRAIRDAVANEEVGAIMLYIESPGGTVAGTKELADDIAAANSRKPVFAFIEDLGASAAYWLASQAGHISANETGLVGSIGTYGVVSDFSAYAAKEGIKVHVVKAGEFKGMGVPGTEITADHLKEMQRNVDALNSFFLRAVSTGRKMEPEDVASLADGRVHIAASAKKQRLIDAVSTYEAAFDLASQAAKKTKPVSSTVRGTGPIGDLSSETTKGKTMSDSQQGPKPATIAEIKAECVGASSDFVLAQAEASATIEQAKSAWMKQLAEQSANLKAENEKLAKEVAAKEAVSKTTVQSKAAKSVGAQLVEHNSAGSDSELSGSALERWNAAVNENRKAMSVDQAIVKAQRDFPGLHSEMLREVNANRSSHRR